MTRLKMANRIRPPVEEPKYLWLDRCMHMWANADRREEEEELLPWRGFASTSVFPLPAPKLSWYQQNHTIILVGRDFQSTLYSDRG